MASKKQTRGSWNIIVHSFRNRNVLYVLLMPFALVCVSLSLLRQRTVTGITHQAQRVVRSPDHHAVRTDITVTGLCVSPAQDLPSLARQALYCRLRPSLHCLHCPGTPQRGAARDRPSHPTVSLPDFTLLHVSVFCTFIVDANERFSLRLKYLITTNDFILLIKSLNVRRLWLQRSVQQISW